MTTSTISRIVAKIALLVSFFFASTAYAAGISFYLSPPGIQTSTVAGATIEPFNSPTGSIGISGSWAIGSYSNNPTTGTINAADDFGGAGHTGSYLAVHTGPITVQLSGSRKYVGFWWSAGDASNQIEFYDASNNLLASFTTASLVTYLGGTGNIAAIDGAQYAKSAYFGNPNLAGVNTAEPYAYVNLVLSGTTVSFKKIVLKGSGFEVDNIAIADATAIDPAWANYGSQTITVPAGEIGLTNDTGTTPFNTALSGNVSTNDTVPAGSKFSKQPDPAHGTVTVNADGTFTYTPTTGFSGLDTFTYQACKPAPDQTICETATVNVAVGPNAVADSASTPLNTAASGSVATNDVFPTGASFAVTTAPSHGTATLNASTGAYTYTPTAGYVGADSFTYQVCLAAPNAGLCSTATTSLMVGGAGAQSVPTLSEWGVIILSGLMAISAFVTMRRKPNP
jgi:hypothetical protein